MEQLLSFYNEYKEKLAAYRLAQSTIYFDIATSAPKAGIDYRNNMMSILVGEAFSYQMEEEHIKKIEKLYELAEKDSLLKKELALYLRLIESDRKVPKEKYVEFFQVIAESEKAWQEAKEQDELYDFLSLSKKSN